MGNKIERFHSPEMSQIAIANENEMLTPEGREQAQARYNDLAEHIKSSDTESTVMNFHFAQVIGMKGEERQAEKIAKALMIKDKAGVIGVIGISNDLISGFDREKGGNYLAHKDEPETSITTLEPTFAAIIKPDGSIEGELPQKLVDFLTYKKVNEGGKTRYVNANFGSKGGSITTSYFRSNDKRLLDTSEIEKLSQQLLKK